MIRIISYLLGASGWVALYITGLAYFHYSWAVLLLVLGYTIHLWSCGVQAKTDRLLIYTKQRKTVYDYEPFRYWVKIDKKNKKVLLNIQETDYAYFATYPTFFRLFHPSKHHEIPFETISHFIFSKRLATLTTEGGGRQLFKPIWEIHGLIGNKEQLFAESSDEYFVRRLARHIAILAEKDLIDETLTPQIRYSSKDLLQPYYASTLKKNLGVTQGVRERRLDLVLRLSQTKNQMLITLYLFFTVLTYFCYVSLSNTLIKIIDFSAITDSFLELSRFGVLFLLLYLPTKIPIRVSFFVNHHGITYLEQIPIFSKQYYFPKDDLYDVVVCQLQSKPQRQQGKLLLVSERHLFTIKTWMEDLLYLKNNLDVAIKAVLHFHFPEEVSLDQSPSAPFTLAQQKSTTPPPIVREKPFIRFAQRRLAPVESTPEKSPIPETTPTTFTPEITPPVEKKKTEKISGFSQVPSFIQVKAEEALQSPQTITPKEFRSQEIPVEEPSLDILVQENIPTQKALPVQEDIPAPEETPSPEPVPESIPSSLLQNEEAPPNLNASSDLIVLEEVLPDQMLSSDSEMIVLEEVHPETLVENENVKATEPEEIIQAVEASDQVLPEIDEALATESLPIQLPSVSSKKNTRVIAGKDAFEKGLALLQENQVIRAMNAFNQAIQENPSLPEAHYQMGLIHLKLFEHPEAVQCFTQAIQLNPRYMEALEARADAYGEIGEREKSVADYKKLISLNPARKTEIQRKMS